MMPYKDRHTQKRRQKEIQFASVHGFLMRKHRSMLSRVCGQCTDSPHLYLGTPLLKREEFLKWAKENEQFLRLHKDYVESGFLLCLCPVPDRLDPAKGYVIGNMEWVTNQENNRRAKEKGRKR